MTNASFGEAEFRRLFIPDEALEALSLQSARMFLQHREDAAPVIATLLKSHLIKRTPISLLRVGDGEGNVLSLTRGTIHPDQLDAFNAKFHSQIGMNLRENEAQALCEKIRQALSAADCLGFRLDSARSEYEVISAHLADGQVGAALGILYARTFLHEELVRGHFSDKVITSVWVHYPLISYICDIMDAAPAVIVITGRAQLEPHFESRLGKRLRSFIAVPPQGYRPATEEETHYRNAFPRVLDALRADLQGTLVLVGAGFLGKLYCDAAKNSGAVALDFGSAFDILAGMSTRPVHSRLNIDALRWVR